MLNQIPYIIYTQATLQAPRLRKYEHILKLKKNFIKFSPQEIESVIKYLPVKIISGLDGSTGKFY